MDCFRNTGQPDWDWWGRPWPAPGATLRELGLAGGDRVVEIGSGNGYFALPAARVAAPETAYAVDVDADLLGDLDALAAMQEVENVTAVEGDARATSGSCARSTYRRTTTGSSSSADAGSVQRRQRLGSLAGRP